MTNQLRKPIVSDTTAKTPESGIPLDTPSDRGKKADPTRSPRSFQPTTVLALLVALAALGSSGYIGWRGLTLESRLANAQPFIEQLTRQQGTLEQTSRQINRQAQTLSQRQDSLQDRLDRLTGQVRNLEGSARADWYLAEVEYLLRLANQRLLMAADINGARALLTSADELVKKIDSYNLFALRQALAEDQERLNRVPEFDQEGIYLKLQALSQQLLALPLLDSTRFTVTKNPEPVTVATPNRGADSPSWRDWLGSLVQGVWQEFSSLFRFTADRGSRVEVLLTPEQEGLIRQSLQLLLEQGKLALLARQQQVYQGSLDQAIKQLQSHFSLAGDDTRGVISELEQLARVNINPDRPVINRALEALKQVRVPPTARVDESGSKPMPSGEQE